MQNSETSEVRCVWILSGSPEPRLPASLDRIPSPDLVIAADGGSALLEELGVRADLAVGDFDSIDPALLERLEADGVEIARFQHHLKLETDTELALMAALPWQPETIIIFGAIGGRLDHALANVFLLAAPKLRGYDVRIIEGEQEAYLLRPGIWNQIRAEPNSTVSLLPIGGDVTGVQLRGFEYPLTGQTLPFGPARGVSNVLLETPGEVWADSGDLLVVISHDH